jgi:3-(methylthio)propionyl---CoA ligase
LWLALWGCGRGGASSTNPQAGHPLPHDGRSLGEIEVRGLWVCSGYYRAGPSAAHDAEEWFATGDVGTIDTDGYLHITDRKKDLIKCAGEWVSSVEVENLALQPGSQLRPDEILASYAGLVAKWAVPHRVIVLDTLPLGATGKVQKTRLRKMYAGIKTATSLP